MGDPTTPVEPGPDASGDELVAYLVANRDRFTRAALTYRLLEVGHSTEAIAAAWVEADAHDGTAARAEAAGPPRARQTVLVLAAILVAFAAFLVGEWGIMAGAQGRPLMVLYAVLFPVQIALATGWLIRRIEASTSLRSGDWFMTVAWLLIPPVAMLALIGICFGYSASFGCYLHC